MRIATHNIKNAQIMLCKFLPYYEPQDVELPPQVEKKIWETQEMWTQGAGSVIPHETLCAVLAAMDAPDLVVHHNQPRSAPEKTVIRSEVVPPVREEEVAVTDPSSYKKDQVVVVMTDEGIKKGTYKGRTSNGLLKVLVNGSQKQSHFDHTEVQPDQPELTPA